MKRNLILIAFFSCTRLCYAQENLSGTFHLNAQVSSIKNAYMAYLTYTGVDNSPIVDSMLVTNGNVRFKGIINQPRLAKFTVLERLNSDETDLNSKTQNETVVYLEPSLISIISKDKLEKLKVIDEASYVMNRLRDNYVITGSHINDEYHEIQELMNKRYRDDLDLLAKTDSSNISLRTRLKEEISLLNYSFCKDIYLSYFKTHLNEFISVYALLAYLGLHVDPMQQASIGVHIDANEAAPLYSQLASKYLDFSTAKYIKSRIDIAKATTIGEPATDFEMPDTAGKFIRLSSFKGNYLLIDFWASWCSPCRTTNPELLKIYEKYKYRNFNILGISSDTDKNKWLNAIKEDKLPWQQVSDLKSPNKATALYYVEFIPMSYLVDPEGKIVAKGLGMEDLDKKLAELLR